MPEEIKYLPFNAINEFMRDDYRIHVLTEVQAKSEILPADKKSLIGKSITRFVSVPGFRNGNLAPLAKKAKSSVALFEKAPDFCGAVLECWKSLHPELAAEMYAILSEKGWEELQPLELDRSKLAGFLIHWPKGDTFEVLIQALRAKKPELDESEDNISLMAVWIGNRLPYDLYIEDEEKKE